MESAKIFAENVIRNRKEALNLKRFGVKMGALASKLESAYRTQQISETISKTVPMLQRCMQKMDTLGVNTIFSYNVLLINYFRLELVFQSLKMFLNPLMSRLKS